MEAERFDELAEATLIHHAVPAPPDATFEFLSANLYDRAG